jgi:glycosyltransferase involved in cell wall biosynthesis
MNQHRVCIDARVQGLPGGIAQVVIGLAHGLSGLADGDEEYVFLVRRDGEAWVKPYLRRPCPIVFAPEAPAERSVARRSLDRVPGARYLWDRLSPALGRRSFQVPRSDGTIEDTRSAVVHFALQTGCLTPIPSIYQPHDLQHRHLPDFFPPRHRMTRDLLMKPLCEQARAVAVVSTWVKQDLVRQYGLAEEKIHVVPTAPPTDAYPTPAGNDLAASRGKFHLPESFILYPAQTFEHKNHLRLLEALRWLRDRQGLTVPLICCGKESAPARKIHRCITAWNLQGQVRLVGYVSALELQCLYRLCRAVVIPSLFEAASFPLWEAFAAGAPAACSNVTSLPAQAGDAALVFDPLDPQAMADSVRRLWTDQTLRQTLIERGRANVARFTWERTARHYRALYRQTAGWPLTEEDRAILAAPAML